MSFHLQPHAAIAPEVLAQLQKDMAGFYRNPPPQYYQIADRVAGGYTPKEYPFHCDLVSQVTAGMQVLEMGCGTAHLCPYIEQRGGIYTGMDHSDELLEKNRANFPRADFVDVTASLEKQFDLVASLYTLEHTVNPPEYLERMRSHCRPGGLLAIICPEFVSAPAFPPSVFYGRTPRSLRKKLTSLSLLDAGLHLIDWKWKFPRAKKHLRESPPGGFWMNLNPSVLRGGIYTIDADAVYLSSLKDIVYFFQQRGDSLIKTSAEMTDVSAGIKQYNCYALIRKQA